MNAVARCRGAVRWAALVLLLSTAAIVTVLQIDAYPVGVPELEDRAGARARPAPEEVADWVWSCVVSAGAIGLWAVIAVRARECWVCGIALAAAALYLTMAVNMYVHLRVSVGGVRWYYPPRWAMTALQVGWLSSWLAGIALLVRPHVIRAALRSAELR